MARDMFSALMDDEKPGAKSSRRARAALNRLKAPGYAPTSMDDLVAALLGRSMNFLSQPQRMGARGQSRNHLNINHPLAESSAVARIPISMVPFFGGPASGYTQEDIATLQLPEATTIASPFGMDITDKGLAKFGLAMDAVDWVPGASILGGMATGAGLLGRALKRGNYADTTGEALEMAVGAGGALDSPGKGLAAIIGGERAAGNMRRAGNANPSKSLTLAAEMDEAGASADEIWRATGEAFGYPSMKGADGLFRFEIDDSQAATKDFSEFESYKWDRDKDDYGMVKDIDLWREYSPIDPRTPDEFITHNALSDAYPGMVSRDADGNVDNIMYVKQELSPDGGSYGEWTDTENMGRPGAISVGAIEDAAGGIAANKSATLHELTHAVAREEGFARGGLPDEFAHQPLNEKALDLVFDLHKSGGVDGPLNLQLLRWLYSRPASWWHEDFAQREVPGARIDAAKIEEIAKQHGFKSAADALEFLRIEDIKRSPYGQYRRLAGEEEARAVQKRMDLTQPQRIARPFYRDFDTPMDEQTVLQRVYW